MSRKPDQEWWTSTEIAEAKLPHMPITRKGVIIRAQELGWQSHPKLSRRRTGKGGGWEYHWTLLSYAAQKQLLAAAKPAPTPAIPTGQDRDAAWAWYEELPASVTAKAEYRLKAIQTMEALRDGGLTLNLAAHEAAELCGCSHRSIFNWWEMIQGISEHDRLPYLAPRHRRTPRKSQAHVIHPRFLDLIKADYLRLGAPALTACYRRSVRTAKAEGVPVTPLHTIRRWLQKNISEPVLVLKRKGYEALKELQPSQVRDKTALHAMEGVNGDFHRFDVFVRFPATADGQPEEVGRIQMCAFQDIYSGKILAHRFDRTANSHCVQLTIGDMVEKWGIPENVVLDNGREFAAKLITGGVPTRFRFKVREDDPSGLLVSLGCEIRWAQPYSGQSKPIERAFRDLAEDIAKHPAFQGAYTGNKPDAKPEDYGSAAIPQAIFEEIANECIAEHNARQDRRSEVAMGRSFNDVFAESYAAAPIRKATAEQRRLWLMGAEGIKANARTGQIMFMRNAYWADWMHEIIGKKVVVRFDRDDLWAGLHVYSLQDEYLGFAPCQAKKGFFTADDARQTGRDRAAYRKAVKAEAKAHLKLTAREVAQAWADAPSVQDVAEKVEAEVIKPVFERPKPKATDDRLDREQAQIIADLDARRAERATAPEEDARDRFLRARELDRVQAEDGTVTKDQMRWLSQYKDTAEYRTYAAMVEDFGEEALAKE